MSEVQHIAGETYHGRKGDVGNKFRYSIDYVLLDPEKPQSAPKLFGRNASGLMSVHDRDHGGQPKAGHGAAWVRQVLSDQNLPFDGPLRLLAQPRVLGHIFNPVSFWLCYDREKILRAVIAEVTNTYGDRHSYLCFHDNHREITKADTLKSRKIMHVSPFQPVEGEYVFRFDIGANAIHITIDYTRGNGGVIATLKGPIAPLTTGGMISASLRRPFGSRRVLALIHWQALKLWWKGAPFRSQPPAPAEDVSR